MELKTTEPKFYDMLGRELLPGDVFVYAESSGSCTYLTIQEVIDIKDDSNHQGHIDGLYVLCYNTKDKVTRKLGRSERMLLLETPEDWDRYKSF